MSHTRRDFLKAALGTSTLLSFASAAPSFLARSVMAASSRRKERDTVLVVVQLSGGNDGLNTLVPYEDDEYFRNRPTLCLPTNDLHKIDSAMGFHPRMGAFARLYKDGLLSIIQGVGNPNPDRSHEVAMRIWHTADPVRLNRQTGWLGRATDSVWNPNETNVRAVFVGPIAQPFGLNAEKVIIPSIRSLSDLTIGQMPGYPDHFSKIKSTAESHRKDNANPLLDFLQQCKVNTYANSRRIEAVTSLSASKAEYPSSQLAADFRTVAQLIRADVGTRIFFTEFGGGGIGGFDNHANQLGNHCALLHQLSESVAAFVHDLKRDKLLDRVLLMTFSEFGRTIKENGRRGTGHGSAAPVFLAGGRLKGGLIGPRPSLTDLDNGAPKFHTDFRRVYATVLDRWLGFESRTILDKQFKPLDILNV
ncbi:MAG: hypothetical protein AMJ75_10900 [Phycisphaerae bacterium SM1_79]|nr:MAG: hypothetical protein AMJ75_10900 [Phycisphaerae bacterium SM1_79]